MPLTDCDYLHICTKGFLSLNLGNVHTHSVTFSYLCISLVSWTPRFNPVLKLFLANYSLFHDFISLTRVQCSDWISVSPICKYDVQDRYVSFFLSGFGQMGWFATPNNKIEWHNITCDIAVLLKFPKTKLIKSGRKGGTYIRQITNCMGFHPHMHIHHHQIDV